MLQPKRDNSTLPASGNSHLQVDFGAYNRSLASIIARRATPIVAGGGLLLAGAAQAATINVDSASAFVGAVDDSVNGNCSLVEAVRAANSDAAIDDCEAGSGADNIVLPPEAVFSFTAGFVGSDGGYNAVETIASDITIQGNGAVLERSAAAGTPDFRFFEINTGASLNLSQTTLRNGVAPTGGAIRVNQGALTLTQSTLTGNTATATTGIYGSGGGAIASNTNLVGVSSRIENSTISGNTAAGPGGGIRNQDGRLVLYHNTITGNSAGQAGSGVQSYADNYTETVVTATIISGNANNDDVSSDGDNNSFTSNGGNLIGTGDAIADFNNPSADETGNTTPGLAPLADNGGPSPTHLPQTGSAALDALPFAPLPADQRGNPRPLDGDGDSTASADKGAVEFVPPIIVDGNTVVVDGADGDCSLLEAIVNANDTTGTPPHADCAPGSVSGPDVVQLPEDQTFSLTAAFGDGYGSNSGLPAISSEIIIEGNGSNIERDSGAGDFRVAVVGDPFSPGGDLTLRETTLSGGQLAGTGLVNQGGGVLSFGALSLQDSTLSGNTVSYLGGGIFLYNGSRLHMQRSTIAGNSAGQGGGLQVGPTASAVLINSTVSGNSASVTGGITNFGSLDITHSTFADNSSNALSNVGSATTTLTNNLVVGGPCYGAGANTLAGTNLASDASCSNFNVSPEAESRLGPLADNGGPTQTHLPMPGHPAIDAAPTSGTGGCPAPATGQRGVSRPQNGGSANACDVGAVEVIEPIVVGGACTLIQAINNANDTVNGVDNSDCAEGSPAGPDIITLPNGNTYTYTTVNNTLNNNNGLPSITSDITILGNGATLERSSAGGTPQFRLLHVSYSGTLALDAITLRNGIAALDGGGLFNAGTATVTNSTVSGNTSNDDGGGINNRNLLTLINSTVSNNSAAYYGGGIYGDLAETTLAHSTVTGNTSDSSGGGISQNAGTATLTNSLISGNMAVENGMELENYNGQIIAGASNLFGENSVNTADAFFDFTPGAGDINATADGDTPTALDDILLGLTNNGGGTLTHNLPPNSPAVDAVQGACGVEPVADQIGTVRPRDGNLDQQARCDIGAVERIADTVTDSDTDNIPDDYEIAFGLTVGVDDSGDDLDGDGLSNGEEFTGGAQANNPDSDGDILGDAIDLDPANDSNACVPDATGMAGDMEFSTPAPAGFITQCGSTTRITVRGNASLEGPDAELELFAPNVAFEADMGSMFAAPLGTQLRIEPIDPVPGAAP